MILSEQEKNRIRKLHKNYSVIKESQLLLERPLNSTQKRKFADCATSTNFHEGFWCCNNRDCCANALEDGDTEFCTGLTDSGGGREEFTPLEDLTMNFTSNREDVEDVEVEDMISETLLLERCNFRCALDKCRAERAHAEANDWRCPEDKWEECPTKHCDRFYRKYT